MRITRRLEFDAGHRIPHHASQCRHLHGHRYAIEVTVSGEVIVNARDPEQGMVADFGAVKDLVHEHVVAPWDHSFLVHAHDRAVIDFLATLLDHRTVVFAEPPTAEHLAATAFERLERAIAGKYGERLRLERVRIFETPNCWADAFAADL